jgi:hypothetical protein
MSYFFFFAFFVFALATFFLAFIFVRLKVILPDPFTTRRPGPTITNPLVSLPSIWQGASCSQRCSVVERKKQQSSAPPVIPNWSEAEPTLVQEICRLAEAQLAAQLQLAIAADQRAAVLAGFFGAAATGIVGAIATVVEFRTNRTLFLGSAETAAMLLFAAVWCIFALLPIGVWTPGNQPSEWYADVTAKKSLVESMGQQAAFYDDHIDENNSTLANNAGWLRLGAVYGVGAPFVGLTTAALVALFHM